MKYHLGIDHIYFLKEDLYYFLSFVKGQHIAIYSLSYDHIYFHVYIPIIYRHHFKKYKHYYYIKKTYGFISYIFILFSNIYRILFIFSFFIFLFYFTQLIFEINISGLDDQINQSLLNTIRKEDIYKYTKQLNYEELNDLLLIIKEDYNEKVEYLNIYKKGSSFNIEYVKRQQIKEDTDSYKPIYAKEKGIIYKINVSKGLVKVKINDYVSKGDLLVDNHMITTNNKTEIIPVKGNIYAYTFKTYTASCNYIEDEKVDIIYQLLFEIRKQLPLNAYIDKENVLQMEVNHSKITLIVQYTLIEDISI